MNLIARRFALAAAMVVAAASFLPQPVAAATAGELQRDAQAALNKLYAKNAAARTLQKQAVAILVFPSILKAGLGIGGQFGDGVLYRGGKAVAYYNTTGASYGLQAGAQRYGYALFFQNEAAVKSLDRSGGFELGVGPSLVVVDEAFAKQMTSKTMTHDIYAFIFDQQGAMAGLGIQGNKITRIDK